MNNTPVLPPAYLFASLSAMVLLHFLVPVYQLTAYPWNAIGLLPLITGAGLNLTADATLKKQGTTVKPFEASSALITTGVYSLSRNPMYLGMSLILIGVALLMGSLTPYTIVPGFIIIIDRAFIRPEEVTLNRQFGEAWTAYVEGVRRWL
ncbi:MAG: isoprenylcysteine carboxylmethyltransferase family protein [Gammaproteobacteria bacterium]